MAVTETILEYQRYAKKLKISCLVLLHVMVTNVGTAQDLEQIANRDILSASGGIGLSQIYYHTKGTNPSRKPYTYLLTGNLQFKLLGFIDAPFLFFYSNLGNGFTQPTFNQTSLHPKYKWVQTHFGTISCSWSPYTLNGHVFQGGAVELSPGNWQIALSHGRFMKRTEPAHHLGVQSTGHSWKRLGTGARILWSKQEKGSFGASVFGARDEFVLDTFVTAFSPPKSNMALSVNGNMRILKNLRIQGDLATSVLTEDTRVKKVFYGGERGSLFSSKNSTTRSYRAAKVRTELKLQKTMLHLGYERIDPGYRTLGAYYFNNDLENVSLGASSSFMHGKVQLQGNIGKQRDNLDGTKLSFMQRTVGSAFVQIQTSDKWSLQGNYSNFLSHTNLRSFTEYQNNSNPYQSWDTLNFRQLSQNAGFTLQLHLRKDTLVNRFANVNIIAQTAAEKQNGTVKNGSLFLNAVASIGQMMLKSGTSAIVSCGVAKTDIGGVGVLSISPACTIGATMFQKRIKTNFSAAVTKNYGEGIAASGVLNLRNQWNCTFAKMHHLSLSFLLLQKNLEYTTQNAAKAYRESTISVTYSVNTTFFDLKKEK